MNRFLSQRSGLSPAYSAICVRGKLLKQNIFSLHGSLRIKAQQLHNQRVLLGMRDCTSIENTYMPYITNWSLRHVSTCYLTYLP